jgi:enoyl-CoA hydratase
VTLTGSGSAFCTGKDAQETMQCDAAMAVAAIDRPVIAALNGDASGEGLEIALAADIRIAAATARFGLPQIAGDAIPSDGGTQRLPRIVGLGRALDLIITGKLIDCEEAYRIGLVNEIVPAGKLMERTMELAETICSFPQGAIRTDKEATLRGVGTPLTEGLRMESQLFNTLLGTHDFLEGPLSFVQKRPPEFDNQ